MGKGSDPLSTNCFIYFYLPLALVTDCKKLSNQLLQKLSTRISRQNLFAMPRCDGLPSGRCPNNTKSKAVRLSQGDLILCPSCDEAVRFPNLQKTVNIAAASASTDKKCTKPTSSSTKTILSSDQSAKVSAKLPCPKCHEETDVNCITCDICCDRLYPLRTGLATETFNALLSITNDCGWLCADCRSTDRNRIVNLQSSLSRVTEQLADLRSS